MQTKVEVSRSPILGIPVIKHRLLGDDRGPFGIPIELDKLAEAGFQMAGPLNQLNYSRRAEGNAFGVHVSNTGKYCFVLPGSLYYAQVTDLRDPDSETFGQTEAFTLEAGVAIYVPAGYGNAGQAGNDEAWYVYALDGVFDPKAERKLSILDPSFGLCWRMEPTGLSLADQTAMSLGDYAEDRRKVLTSI